MKTKKIYYQDTHTHNLICISGVIVWFVIFAIIEFYITPPIYAMFDYGNTIIKSVWFWIVWIIVSLMTLGPLFVVAMYPVMLIDDYFEYKWNKQNKG